MVMLSEAAVLKMNAKESRNTSPLPFSTLPKCPGFHIYPPLPTNTLPLILFHIENPDIWAFSERVLPLQSGLKTLVTRG